MTLNRAVQLWTSQSRLLVAVLISTVCINITLNAADANSKVEFVNPVDDEKPVSTEPINRRHGSINADLTAEIENSVSVTTRTPHVRQETGEDQKTPGAAKAGESPKVPDAQPAPPVSPAPGEGTAKVPKPGESKDGVYLSLEDCVEIAILNNLGLKINRLSDRAADVNARVAWAQYYPTFNLGYNHSNSQASGHNAGPASNNFTSTITQESPWGTTLNLILDETRIAGSRAASTSASGLNVSQHLWQGFGTNVGLAGIREARINRLISRGNLDLQTQQLIFNVRSAYANINREVQQIEVDRRAVASAKTFLDLTGARFRAGQVTQLDVLQADVQLHTRELTLVTDQRLLENARDQLKQLMDLSLEETIRTDVTVIDFSDKPDQHIEVSVESDEHAGVVSLVSRKDAKVVGEPQILFRATHFDDTVIMREALDNRIDLLNSRRGIAIQKLQTLLQKDGLGYQVDLVGSFNKANNGHFLFEGDNNKEDYMWTAGVNASIPWGKIKDKGAYELALLDLQRAEISLKQTWTQVQLDVRNIMRILREAEKSLMINGQRVEQAKRAVQAAHISFERGLKDSFEVIIAEDNFLQAETDFISQRLDYVVDLAQLEVVVGKPTGRIGLGGETAGGIIDARAPEVKMQVVPMPEPTHTAAEDPFTESREYRNDYKFKKEKVRVIDQKDLNQ